MPANQFRKSSFDGGGYNTSGYTRHSSIAVGGAASSQGRPLGHVRISARGEAIKLPPVELIPSRSFNDTFIRGLQVGKPAVANIGTQVNEHHLLFPTPVPSTPGGESDEPSDDVSGIAQLRNPMERIEEASGIVPQVGASTADPDVLANLKNQVNELLDELHEAKERERSQKEKAKRLNQMYVDVKEESTKKDNIIASLQAQLQQEQIKVEQEREKALGAYQLQEEIDRLTILNNQLLEEQERVKQTLETLQKDRESLFDQLKKQHEAEMAHLKNEMEKGIFLRDEKLERMRKTMEAMMGDKSNERQKQLDDLTKDLAKVLDECDLLRAKLRNYQNKQKASCDNCGRLSYKLEEKISVLSEKEKQVQKFVQDNNTLRSQLVQQDKNIDQIAQMRASQTITVYK